MANVAAIVGTGVIGAGWAARFVLNGWDVRLFDPDPEAAARTAEVIEDARRALPMLYDVALPAEGRLTRAASIAAAVAGAAWVQESVPERLQLKRRAYAQIEAAAPADSLIASSTSGFRPSQLRDGLARPERLVVAHPFNPVYLLPLVELVGDDAATARASSVLRDLGMKPLVLRREIDGHVADRLMESLWREALWLVRDGIATTAEIDDAIRFGFGLRWGQMGLFETYRIAGGAAGVRHFLHQFGPALAWPWSRLTDVPALDDALVETIASQSDAQSGHLGIRELAQRRDRNLVAMIRALKTHDAAAGAVVRAHEARLAPTLADMVPLVSARRRVPSDWADANGHMNEGRYGQVFADAADAVLAHVGAGADYIARGLSYFTAETAIKFVAETRAGADIRVDSRVTLADGKKLRLWHEMRGPGDVLLATCDQFLLHVSLQTRRSCAPEPDVGQRLEALAAAHAGAA